MMALMALLAGMALVALCILCTALLVGAKVQITEEDRARAKSQPLIMLVHRDYRWTLPALAEDFFARILPEMISSSQQDARTILSGQVTPMAYAYLALLGVLLVAMKAAYLLCRWSPMKRRLAQWEGTLLDALSGLLVSMARCHRAWASKGSAE